MYTKKQRVDAQPSAAEVCMMCSCIHVYAYMHTMKQHVDAQPTAVEGWCDDVHVFLCIHVYAYMHGEEAAS